MGELNGSSIQADLPFHVASVGKAFTATLIGILIDENKMTLD
jgi:CubicO group peptidase (beta-lactamase class C family)